MADEFDDTEEGDEQFLASFRDSMTAARTVDDQVRFEQTSQLMKEQSQETPAGGAGGSNPAATALQGAGEAIADSPIGKFGKAVAGTVDWIKKVPKNLSLGLMDAAVNTAQLPFEMAESETLSGVTHALAESTTGKRLDPSETDVHISAVSPAYRAWRQELRDDSSIADTLTQGVAQFAVPFAGFTKAFGVSKANGFLSNVARLGAAEAATASTVLAPQDGRMADLIDLGRHAENKFGEVLRAASPDGSLQNQYIEWMVDRENETALEGRFKNTVDSLGFSAALGTFLKVAGTTFKGVRSTVRKLSETPIEKPAPKSEVKVAPGGFQETHSGLVFKDEKDAADTVEVLAHQFGPGFEQRQAAEWTKATDKNFATLHSFANVLKANVDKPVSTHSLVVALERNIKGDTETGAFYKELLGRLKSKNLGGMTTVTSEGRGTARGGYVPGSNAIKLHPNAFIDGPAKLLHVFTHEAVHAATVRAVRESPEASAKLTRLHKRLTNAFDDETRGVNSPSLSQVQPPKDKPKDANKQYGFTDPEEFIAEIESNPEFRKLMKDTLIDGESAWDRYKKAISGILGIGALAASPEFDKLMDPKQEEEDTSA